MEKKKNLQMGIIGVLAVAVLFMAIGFAAYSQTLNIDGDVTVKASKWSIHWDTSSYQLSSGSVQLAGESGLPTLSNTDVSFATTLAKPGDYVEFSIDAVNDGTIDANLTGITMTSSVNQPYLSYQITYDGTPYTATTTGLSIPLDAEDSATVVVKVTYVSVANPAQLPQTDVDVTVSANFDYEQAV